MWISAKNIPILTIWKIIILIYFCAHLNLIEDNSIHDLDYSFSFETDKISLDDMNAIGAVKRIVSNSEYMAKLLKENIN